MLDLVDAGDVLKQLGRHCFVSYIDVIKLISMNYKLVMIKERYDVLKEKMSDRVIFDRDEIDADSVTHWVHFEVVINDRIDLLDFYHAGFHTGYDQGVKVFRPIYD